MYCNIGFKTDRTIGRSTIKFKDIKAITFDTPVAICDNGNISQLVQLLSLNKKNIPAVELNVVESYDEKRAPGNGARFFAFDDIAYKSICKMIETAQKNKHYSPRITIADLICDGDMIVIINADFLFINSLPFEKTFVAVNANSKLEDPIYIKYNPIFYYDSFALYQKDVRKIEVISAREFKHEGRVWYYDEKHYETASFITGAIDNYLKLLEKAKPVVDFKQRYPIFCKDPEIYFDALVEAGFKRKYPEATDEQKDRLEYERAVIKKMGYCDYFLINWDFIDWSRDNNIPIGPGRGSAAGSIVAYCLDITKLDPISNGLYFERFLNPERVSPPDIDTDINKADRQYVIDYIKRKYGIDHVAQIITYMEIKSKSALKDAARLNNVDAFEVNRITTFFPPDKFGKTPTLTEAYEVEAVAEWANCHKNIWEEAKTLEGYTRQTGIHAAGLIISPEVLNETTGIQFQEGQPVVQLSMGDAEKFGLLKMDFLGLETLGIIKETQKLLSKSYYDMEQIKLDDPKVIKAFAHGDTHGIFQFESDGMKNLLKRIQPTCFADVAAATALYRPGPLMSGLTEEFIHNKNSIDPKYFLPEFKELLAETYGVFVYQEQVMLVAQKIAGFSLSRADNLRKAIGKKDKVLMKTMEEEFTGGCTKNGFDLNKAKKLWDQIVKFADYCFNKSHSFAYSLLSYWAMYLKVYHPKEFAVSILSSDMKDSTKLRANFFAFKDRITFYPPYINEADQGFKLCNDGIYMGFGSLKGLGGSAQSIAENGPYTEIVDVILKNKLDTAQLTSLIYAGSFDKMEPNKSLLLGNLERLLKFRKNNQGSPVFNLFDPVSVFTLDYKRESRVPPEKYMEKTCYGFNINHGYMGQNKWLIDSLTPGTIIGNIVEIKRTKTKAKQQDMAIITLETINNKIKVVLFPQMYDRFGLQITKDETYAFKGELKSKQSDEGDEEQSLLVSDMLTEDMITPKYVECICRSDIKRRDVDLILRDILDLKGNVRIGFFERTYDENLRCKFEYSQEIKYDKYIHEKLQELDINVRIEIF